jgi:hypothetical protein
MAYLNRLLPRMTRAQANLVAPVTEQYARAHVVRVLGEGLTKDKDGLSCITVRVLTSEKPGQPLQLVAKDILAQQLAQFAKDGQSFSFTANVSGRIQPYLFCTGLDALEQ